MRLFFDTETTGKANFNLPPAHSSQPNLVQLACELYTDDGTRPLFTLCCIVKPMGSSIPPGATAIHGISTEIAMSVGTSLSWVARLFNSILQMDNLTVIGHNIAFDFLIMERAMFQCDIRATWPTQFCTMQTLTPIMNLPGGYGGKPKWPKLSEAYKFCTGNDLLNAHDALVDLRATKAVHDWILEDNKKKLSDALQP